MESKPGPRPTRTDIAWSALVQLLAILFVSFVIAVAFLFFWGETRHFGPDGRPLPLPAIKAAYLQAVVLFYGPLNLVVAAAFDVIPYGGWVIMFGALLVTVSIQNMLIWAIAKRIWQRRRSRNSLL